MTIPKLQYISQGTTPAMHLENIQKACTAGAEMVQLRLKNCTSQELLPIATEARAITAQFQTRLLINDDYTVAKEVKADGVHLGSTDASPTLARIHLYTWQLIGGTAHTLEQCEQLLEQQVDYISLGPFAPSMTKDTLPTALGITGYAAIVDALQTSTPIIGVGGITTANVEAILQTGVSGLAISEAITRDFNTIKIFNRLLNASSTEEQRYTFGSD